MEVGLFSFFQSFELKNSCFWKANVDFRRESFKDDSNQKKKIKKKDLAALCWYSILTFLQFQLSLAMKMEKIDALTSKRSKGVEEDDFLLNGLKNIICRVLVG